VPQTLVLLHGFGGTRRAWDGVAARLDRERYLPLALDLLGHGDRAAAPAPITFAACVQDVLSRAPARFVLCGYSLGGRVALHVALAAPRRVAALVLVATDPGIEDAAARAARQRADADLAGALREAPIEDFIARWQAQPLFAGDPAEVAELARADQRRNRPDALAAALEGLGTGTMEPLWGRLGELSMPALFLAGDRDPKFRSLGERAAGLLANGRLQVIRGGHRLALENPAGVAGALEGLHAETRTGG
jgi:2-succinyl-6-hydroxy-2,4-cyclohexadiene-1-carboxylate synthase